MVNKRFKRRSVWAISSTRYGQSRIHCSGLALSNLDTGIKKPSSGVVGRPISADPRSSFPLQLMDTWIRECVSNHAECRNFRNEFFPTRVLNVSLGNLSNDPFLQVSDGRIQDKYLVLSHCWGSAPSLTTTTANLEIRKKSIPIESMPANFRDAVWLTRKLGVHHLWIDSLCILQDSTLDWQVESECMGDVYANAFLTIAADNAKNSSEGFLKKRPEGVVDPIINVSCLSADGTRFNDLALREYPATWKYGVNKAVLNERGWALQERVMSTRILHFGEQQLYWECRQVTDAEGGMYFYPHDTSVFSKAQLRDIWNEEEQGSYADELERWYTCLDEYSTRKLTYGKDKLPAIAGIAKSMQNRTPELGAYYAGIWKGDFVRGLLWRAKRIGGLAQLGEYRAPSWSWAALDGPMKHDWFALKYFDPDKFPTIEDVSIRCLGRSDFGEIHSGWVRIKAPMCPAVYLGTPARGVLDIIGPFGEPLQTGNDTENQYHDLYHFGPTSWEPIGPPICCAYFDTPLEVGKLKPFTLMRLGDFSSFIRPDNWWDLASWNSNPWALILDDAGSENGESVHKRVGIARMNDKNAFRGWGALSKKII